MILGRAQKSNGAGIFGPQRRLPASPARVSTPTVLIPSGRSGVGTAYAGPRDAWGLLTIPLAAPVDGRAAGDPLLSVLLDYLQAFLQDDHNATAQWTRTGVAPGQPAVRRVFAHNPSDAHDDREGVDFNTKDLPAMYLWREGSESEAYIADDWYVETSTLKLLWVFPPGVQASQRQRQPYRNALAKCVITAIERGRTPSWVVPGDPDPQASRFGSFLGEALNAFALNVASWRPTLLVVDPKEGGKRFSYPAIEMTMRLEENLEVDANRWTEPAALGLVVSNGTFRVVAQG